VTEPSEQDREQVAALLGRQPRGGFEVVVRGADGTPVVVRNDPFERDGRPMPTRWWLVGKELREAVSRLEAAGGVKQAEAAVGPGELAAAHERYREERDAAIAPGHPGPRPQGGVGGARRGVKCLHAHLAWFLAGGDDPVGRWVAERVGVGAAVAAVDCGTNSTRLLAAGAGGAPLRRLMRITRLGQGVDATGRLDPEAVQRTLAVLSEYREEMDRLGVGPVRMSATSAVRDAANRDEFLDAAEDVVGTRPELLSGEEEGRLSYDGATAGLDPAGGPYLVVDIGGGSTELVAGPGGGAGPEGVISLDVGCVRVTERFLRHDPPLEEEIGTARTAVRAALDRVVASLPSARAARVLVGLAGTVTTLAAIDQGLEHYDRERIHHYVLSRGRVEELASALLSEPRTARSARPGVEPGRADVIAGGALVLAGVMGCLGLERCLVSEADILDGMVASLRGLP
jgi:exopolyphosphatase/guanosine-5'-triphosphate,3'-diphosphate pyrophosphatase